MIARKALSSCMFMMLITCFVMGSISLSATSESWAQGLTGSPIGDLPPVFNGEDVIEREWNEVSEYDVDNFIIQEDRNQNIQEFPAPITGMTEQHIPHSAVIEDMHSGFSDNEGQDYGFGETNRSVNNDSIMVIGDGFNSSYNALDNIIVSSSATPIYQSQSISVSGGTVLQSLYFTYGSSRLGKYDMQKLQKIVRDLSQYGHYNVRVIGHASKPVHNVPNGVKQDVINLRMAMKRAVAVSQYLYNAGINSIGVETVSTGDSHAGQRQKNSQRVDIILQR